MSAEIGKHLGEVEFPAVMIDQGEKLGLLHAVHFIQQQEDRAVEALDPVDGEFVAAADGDRSVDYQREHVDAFEGVLEFVHHLAAENVFGFVNAGRIDEDDLRVVAIQDSLDAIAGGLRLRGNDGYFAADELVDERRFACVGAAYYGDESRFEGHAGIVRQNGRQTGMLDK